MRKAVIIRVAIILIGIAVILAGRSLYYYRGMPAKPVPSQIPSYEGFVISATAPKLFTDNYTQGKGTVLVDLAHNNNFNKEEFNVLWLRLVSRGLAINFLDVRGDLKKVLLGEEKEDAVPAGVGEKKDEEKEPLPDAFIIICPQTEFTKEELETIDKFVAKGGKLFLISDPTRHSDINSLSLKFGLVFEPDYLYNMKENELNYRNIFITNFKENEITKKLQKIVLYTAGSISSANSSLALVDENTFSSLVETRKVLSPIASAREAKVLAIYDLTFMTEPYNGSLDNNQLISNIADWLMPRAKGAAVK